MNEIQEALLVHEHYLLPSGLIMKFAQEFATRAFLLSILYTHPVFLEILTDKDYILFLRRGMTDNLFP